MGYSPGFLLEIGQFSTPANSPQIDITSPARSQKLFWKGFGGVSESLGDFQDLPKSAMFKSMGYSPGFLVKIGQFSTLANSSQIDITSPARSQKLFWKGFGGVSESLERFPGMPKSAMFKSMGYSPGFLLKIGQFSTLANSPQIDIRSPARSQKLFWKGFGGVSESLERFPGLAKIRHVQKVGL